METWPKLQSVKEIQVFLGFANFYKDLISNFIESQCHLPQYINQLSNEPQNIQAEKQDTSGGANSTDNAGSAGRVGGGNENLSNIRKLKNRARPLPKRIFLLPDLTRLSPSF